jgi:carbonic anhydrase/acetyltransferase-like protein (isoleucine patch superfamily)
MRAYRVASGRRIAPFGDLARDLFIATKSLADWQNAACRAAGLELTDVEDLALATERPALVFYDDVFFTEMALRHFLAAVIHEGGEARLEMPASLAQQAIAPLIDVELGSDGAQRFDVFHLAAGGEPSAQVSRERLRERARPVRQGVRERNLPIRLPSVGAAKETLDAPVTARVVAHVRHWVHLLRLSQLAIGVLLLERLRRQPWLMLKLRLLRRRGPWAQARSMRFVHPSARVHPSADLEAAIIGAGAEVHAHAHVHHSVIGDGVVIGDHAVVMGSAIAERAHVLRASYLAGCAAMPGGTLANYKVQLSLFGRDVFLTTSAWLIDAKLKGEVRVEHEGRLLPVGSPFLGSCLGHRVTLGAQVLIEAGRAIPNDSLIVGTPEAVARVIPSYPAGTLLTVRDGRVVPVDRSGQTR